MNEHHVIAVVMATESAAIENSEAESFILHKWQRCHFDLESPDSGPRVKADSITGILQQLYQTRAVGR